MEYDADLVHDLEYPLKTKIRAHVPIFTWIESRWVNLYIQQNIRIQYSDKCGSRI